MIEIVENKRQAIAAASERHGVARLDAFGSALRDDFYLVDLIEARDAITAAVEGGVPRGH